MKDNYSFLDYVEDLREIAKDQGWKETVKEAVLNSKIVTTVHELYEEVVSDLKMF